MTLRFKDRRDDLSPTVENVVSDVLDELQESLNIHFAQAIPSDDRLANVELFLLQTIYDHVPAARRHPTEAK